MILCYIRLSLLKIPLKHKKRIMLGYYHAQAPFLLI